MNNKKRNLIITIIIVAAIIITGIVIFLLNFSSNENDLTILEKKWITDNTNKIIDIDIYNNMPIYSYNGEGIAFNYLDYFTNNYKINFNKISYITDKLEKNSNIAFLMLNNDEKITNRDILIYEDHYVLLSQKDSEVDINNIKNVGILKNDSAILKKYFGENVTINEYEKTGEIVSGLKDKKIDFIVLPNVGSMETILKNQLNIAKHLSDIKRKYVLRVNDNNTYNIMKKIYQEYQEANYKEDYSNNFLNIYFKSTETSDILRKNLNAKTYKYGYTINMPYENNVNNEFVGTISNYLKQFEQSTGIEIEPVEFKNIDELKNAIVVSGDIDFALGIFPNNTLNVEHLTTVPIKNEEYVIVSKKDYNINSIKGLTNEEISVVSSSNLANLCKENNIKTKNYNNTNDLLRNLDDNSIAIIDKETYYYYKNDKLEKYKVIVEDKLGEYNFLLNKKNDPFNSIFDYFISTIDYQKYEYSYNTDITINKDYTLIKVIIFIVSLVAFLSATVYLFNRKTMMNNVISKDEKLKYLDPMTSLKNRSYLNLNIYKWDENVIYPQSVIVIDVNKIKEINDKFGREAGDEIIKKVASILINNQLENTDIIRSGGDEFLIYMVGYQEDKVIEYTKKLSSEMQNIPNSSGVSIGYSMIMDEIKTVDDAINEAISMMTKNKEKKNNG